MDVVTALHAKIDALSREIYVLKGPSQSYDEGGMGYPTKHSQLPMQSMNYVDGNPRNNPYANTYNPG